jgi:hypothetical protein
VTDTVLGRRVTPETPIPPGWVERRGIVLPRRPVGSAEDDAAERTRRLAVYERRWAVIEAGGWTGRRPSLFDVIEGVG